eukprot:891982-Prymnesium_polylepis.1
MALCVSEEDPVCVCYGSTGVWHANRTRVGDTRTTNQCHARSCICNTHPVPAQCVGSCALCVFHAPLEISEHVDRAPARTSHATTTPPFAAPSSPLPTS